MLNEGSTNDDSVEGLIEETKKPDNKFEVKENPVKKIKFVKNKPRKINKPLVDPDNFIPKSIILEDPELTSSVEYSTVANEPVKKCMYKFTEGAMLDSGISFVAYSPLTLVLYLPYAFSKLGVMGSILSTIISSLCCYYTSFLVIRCKYQANANSYHDLIINLTKRKSISYLYHFFYFIYVFGICLVNTHIFNLTISEIFHRLKFNESIYTKPITIACGFLFLVLPSLVFSKENFVKGCRITFLIICFLSIIVAIIINLVYYHKVEKINPVHTEFYIRDLFCLSIIFLLLSVHPNIFRQLQRLNMPTKSRGKRLIRNTTIFQLPFLLSIGFLGAYFNFPRNDSKVSIFYKYLESNKGCFILLTFKGLIAILCEFNMAFEVREAICKKFNCFYNGRNTKLKKLICTIILSLVYVTYFQWLRHQDESFILGIVGGFILSLLMFVFPCYFYLTTFNGYLTKANIYFISFVLIVMILLGICITSQEVCKIILPKI